MKFTGLVSCLALAIAAVNGQTSTPAGAESLEKCASVPVRKEVRSLSTSEWEAYKSAVNKAQAQGWNDWFGWMHDQVAGPIHGNAKFLVFHRRFVADYEKVLQRYNPSVAVPYWNALVDYQQPASSSVLGSNYFGSDGDASSECVTSGLAGSWTFKLSTSTCLMRKFNGANGSINAWYSPEFMTSLLQTTTDYADLRNKIENSLHGAVHLGLNGAMSTMYSPVDPVFWIHHSNIDRLYAQWQAVNPAERNFMYTGVDADKKPVSPTDQMPSYSEPIYSAMRLGYGKSCYTYDTIVAANGDSGKLSSNNGSLSKREAQKCRQRDHAQQLVKQLPKEVVSKFFPKFSAGNAHPLENELTTLSPLKPMSADGNNTMFRDKKACESHRGKMPMPPKLTQDWLKMQGACTEEVAKLEAEAKGFVESLNKANYLSPYLVRD